MSPDIPHAMTLRQGPPTAADISAMRDRLGAFAFQVAAIYRLSHAHLVWRAGIAEMRRSVQSSRLPRPASVWIQSDRRLAVGWPM